MRDSRSRRKPELLAPAGSLEVLKTALRYGADAVYVGGEQYGLRANAKNFSPEDMKEGIQFAHDLEKKLYVTANITAHDRDIPGVREYFESLKDLNPDALIISDPGVFLLAKEICPDIDIHISTQANTVNSVTAKFWYDQGAKRVVTAREMSMAEISSLCARKPKGFEVETFVHGAMCIAHSGRCLLSHYFTGKNANLGACTHPCRWKYHIVEETRPGEYLPIEENERGTYIFNSKDLCMIEHIPELMDAGIDSFKIEGRMKTALYVASVVRAYRLAIDDCFESEEKYRENMYTYRKEVTRCTYRQFTTGFFFGPTDHESQIYDANTYEKGAVYLGQILSVEADGSIWIEQKNKFSVGDEIERMSFDGTVVNCTVIAMYDEDKNPIPNCPHPGQKVLVVLRDSVMVFNLKERGEILRKVVIDSSTMDDQEEMYGCDD